MYSGTKDEPVTRTRKRGSVSSWRGGLFVAMLLVAVVTMTTACSSSSDQGSSGQGDQQGTTAEETTSPSPVEAVQLAYKNTTGAKTAKVDMNISFSLPSGSTTASSSGQQAGMNMNITGQGVVDFENKLGDITAQTPIGDIEAREVGNTIYEKLPENLTSQQKGDQKPWIKVDLDSMAQQQFGTSFSGLQGGAAGNATTDPTQQLGYLEGVSDSVEEVGTEEVRGTPATHYKANIDLDKAAAQQESTQQEGTQLRQVYDQLEQQLGTSTLPVDVWLDEGGRIVRFEMSLPMPVPAPAASQKNANQQGGAQQGQFDLTEELYDYGTPVSVEAPPDDQTSEMTDLAAQQKGKQRKGA